jgi:hypothetical protein
MLFITLALSCSNLGFNLSCIMVLFSSEFCVNMDLVCQLFAEISTFKKTDSAHFSV